MANYFVIGPDGGKYGPADVATLSKWADENRLNAATVLEDADTHEQITAGSVEGIIKPQSPNPSSTFSAPPGPTYAAPPGPAFSAQAGPTSYAPYGRMDPQPPENTDGLIIAAWILGSIGLLCCPILFGVAGIVCAVIAKVKGNPKANNVLIYTIVMTILGMILGAIIGIAMHRT
jgi:hypothetical protein